MKTYLVTGGAGFIGSNFIYYMLSKYNDQIQIINFDSLTYAGNLQNLKEAEEHKSYKFVRGDVRIRKDLEAVFAENAIDYVIHFAAESHVDRSITDPEIFAATNIMGTLNLLNVTKQFWETDDGFLEGKKYIQISTDEVYGSLGDEGYFYEDTPIDPHSPYSASKASADMLVKSYIDTYNFPANISRCSNNYGPYQFPEKLIPLMIDNTLKVKKLPVYGDGLNIRDWLYVTDHAKAIDMIVENGKLGEIYNVGGHNEKTNIEIVELILETILDLLPDSDRRKAHIGKQLINYVEDRKGHDRRYAIAPDKIKNEVGWQPETDFNQGIKMTIQWYLNHTDWLDDIATGDYIKMNNKL